MDDIYRLGDCRTLQEDTLQHAPKLWIDKLMHFICRPGQSLTDVNRRSAGIPFAFSAIFLAKPHGGNRVRPWLRPLLCLKSMFDGIQEKPNVLDPTTVQTFTLLWTSCC